MLSKIKNKFISLIALLLPVIVATPIYADNDLFAGAIIENGKIKFSYNGVGVQQTMATGGNNIIKIVSFILSCLEALSLLVLIVFFAYRTFLLSKSGDNPKARSEAIKALGYVIIAIVVIGGIRFITGLVFSSFH